MAFSLLNWKEYAAATFVFRYDNKNSCNAQQIRGVGRFAGLNRSASIRLKMCVCFVKNI